MRVPGRNNEWRSGVLIGPNLILTVNHAIPWDEPTWSMDFTPAFHSTAANAAPFGTSVVEHALGIRTEKDDVNAPPEPLRGHNSLPYNNLSG